MPATAEATRARMNTPASRMTSLAMKQQKLRSRLRMTALLRKGGTISHHHHDRIFDQNLERADQFCAERAVNGTVIAGQRHAHDLRDLDLAVTDHRTVRAGTDREDRGMRRGE